uniref:Uncharacterized protein n=1 Tax=Skeletonema marinoi TaxID=267567 RepID=A0A7S2LYG3_9STRA|mmetsp:Transcript_31267/g.52972  ORF Transcript_31267/g.52972 Transcript_31267/m.52972 type:complete len:153 (+) Transcript_31267:29-487(+)
MSYQFELALRQYIAAFDGNNNISPAKFRTRFDNLYHKDFNFLSKHGKTLTREEVYEREASKLANGTKVTLIHFRKIGLDCIDVKLGLVNGKEERTIRAVTTITDRQAVTSKEIDESPASNHFILTPTSAVMAAKCANAVYKWKEFGTFQTNM